ncbi:hypothetical protein Gotur_014302 [Gossypium turneri]
MKGAHWTFNNHLLVFHRLQAMKDPMLVPLFYSHFLVQVNDLTPGFYSEAVVIQLGNFIENYNEYDGNHLNRGTQHVMRIKVLIDVRSPLQRKKKIHVAPNCYSYAWLRIDVDGMEMEWDISLRAPPARRVVVTESIWLQNSRSKAPEAFSNVNRVLGMNLDGKTNRQRLTVFSDRVFEASNSEEKGAECFLAHQKNLSATTKGGGYKGGLSLEWKPNIDVNLKSFSSSHVDVEIKGPEDDTKWQMTGFYGSLDMRNQNESWHLL